MCPLCLRYSIMSQMVLGGRCGKEYVCNTMGSMRLAVVTGSHSPTVAKLPSAEMVVASTAKHYDSVHNPLRVASIADPE